MPKPRLSEADIQERLLDYLKLKPVYVWRNNSGALFERDERLVRYGKDQG